MDWISILWTVSVLVFLILPVTIVTTGPFRMARRFLLSLLLHTLFMATIQARLHNTLVSLALNIWLGVILNVVLATALNNIPERIRVHVVPYAVLATIANLALYTVLKLARNTLLNIILSSVCYPMLNLQILHLVLFSLDTQMTPSAIFYNTFTPLLRRLILHYNLDLADGYFTDPFVPPPHEPTATPETTTLPRATTPPTPADRSFPKFCTTTPTTYLCNHTLTTTTHTPNSLLCLTTRARSHCPTHTAVGCGCPSGRSTSATTPSIPADELCNPILDAPIRSPDPCPACRWRRTAPDRSDWAMSATGRLVPNERGRGNAPAQPPSPRRPQYMSPPLQRTRFT